MTRLKLFYTRRFISCQVLLRLSSCVENNSYLHVHFNSSRSHLHNVSEDMLRNWALHMFTANAECTVLHTYNANAECTVLQMYTANADIAVLHMNRANGECTVLHMFFDLFLDSCGIAPPTHGILCTFIERSNIFSVCIN